jgi:hypothetical protein
LNLDPDLIRETILESLEEMVKLRESPEYMKEVEIKMKEETDPRSNIESFIDSNLS